MKAQATLERSEVTRLELAAETNYDRRTLARLAAEFRAFAKRADERNVLVMRDTTSTTTQQRVLRCLDVESRPLTAAAIAERTGIARTYVRTCLVRLLAAGCVTTPHAAEYRFRAYDPSTLSTDQGDGSR